MFPEKSLFRSKGVPSGKVRPKDFFGDGLLRRIQRENIVLEAPKIKEGAETYRQAPGFHPVELSISAVWPISCPSRPVEGSRAWLAGLASWPTGRPGFSRFATNSRQTRFASLPGVTVRSGVACIFKDPAGKSDHVDTGPRRIHGSSHFPASHRLL